MRNLLCRNLNSHITSGNHNSIAGFQDGIQIFDTLCILNLCNNKHIGTMLIQNLTNLTDCRCISDKGGRDHVKSGRDSKEDILLVLVGQSRELNFHIWYIDSLLLPKLTSIDDSADNIISPYFFHIQLNQSVVNKDLISRHHISGKPCIVDKASPVVTHDFICGERIKFSRLQSDLLSVLQISRANLRTLGVKQGCDWKPQLFTHTLEDLIAAHMLLVISVGKIKTRHIHSI
ncbi:eC1118_1A20_0364p [Clostridium sp. CAG:149]|nr:eC1118_1A20_0364p [Clostridium sp. CAG:149]